MRSTQSPQPDQPVQPAQDDATARSQIRDVAIEFFGNMVDAHPARQGLRTGDGWADLHLHHRAHCAICLQCAGGRRGEFIETCKPILDRRDLGAGCNVKGPVGYPTGPFTFS